MKILRFVLVVAAIAPVVVLSSKIGGFMLAGYTKSESVWMSLGQLLPISLFFVIALYALEQWTTRRKD